MKALLCLDFENDIVHADGKVSGKGYTAFAEKHGTLARVRALQEHFRNAGLPVVHVRVGFSPSYHEQPKTSPLLGKAHEFGAFMLEVWGTEFLEDVAPEKNELIITKHRVGSFFGTPLQLALRNMQVDELVLTGVATDMVVESTAREAHDRDFLVTVVADCCIAANDEDQVRSLANMQKLATIVNAADLEL